MSAPQSTSQRIGGVHVVTTGTGPGLLVLGGIHLSHEYLRPGLDVLADRAQVIYVDYRGTGQSDRPHPAELTHAAWVADLLTILDGLGLDRVHVMGHSYGGYIALELALAHPDRVHKLALVCASPAFDYPEVLVQGLRQRVRPALAERVLTALGSAPATDAELDDLWWEIQPAYYADPERVAPPLPGTCSVLAYAQAYGRCLPGLDLTERLRAITSPALVLSGAQDWIMPPEQGGRRLAAQLPNSRFVVCDASGHYPFVEEPQRFHDEVTAWLRD